MYTKSLATCVSNLIDQFTARTQTVHTIQWKHSRHHSLRSLGEDKKITSTELYVLS